MPELPEVETVRLQLLNKIVGKTISAVEVLHQKTIGHDGLIEEKLIKKTIADIMRVGKLLIFSFSNEDNLFLLAHLKMTGQFFYIDSTGDLFGGGHSATAADLHLPSPHTRIILHFTDGTKLYFNDMRLFGYIKTATKNELAAVYKQFGPEPIQSTFDRAWFAKELKRKKTSVKAALLNQSFIAGLGNIYVDEALWRAKVAPTRLTNTVTEREAHALSKAAGDVMNESIAVGGTTFQNFKDLSGKPGNFKDSLAVFGKQGKACPRCGNIIIKTKVVGRGTHYCPNCQK